MIYRNAYEYLIARNHQSFFTPEEWPVPEDLKFVKAEVIYELNNTRRNFGKAVFPSRVPEGLVRRSGSRTSRHYIGDGRLGMAVDVFPSVNVMDFWLCAVENLHWRGIGVYLDTNVNSMQPQPMVHLDIDNRSHGQRALWVRDEKGVYIHKSTDPELFWELLAKASTR